MTDEMATQHERVSGDLGIASRSKGLNYFIRKSTESNTIQEGVLIGISGRIGLTYLTPQQAKVSALELLEIVEEYC